MSNDVLVPESRTEPAAILDPLDTRVRIEALKLLEKGWLDGQGVAPPHDGLDWLADAFDSLYPDESPLPYLFPTPEGRLLAEWSIAPWAVSLEIDLVAKSGQWHSLNLDTDVEETRDLDLTIPTDWEWIVEQLHNRVAENA